MIEKTENDNAEGLLTFGGLLKLKREKMGISQVEAINRSKITGLNSYERDIATPQKNMMLRIISFFKLTEEEIQSCRKPERRSSNFSISMNLPKIGRLTHLLDLLCSIKTDVQGMDIKGHMASKLQLDSLDNIDKAFSLLQDALIIERLI